MNESKTNTRFLLEQLIRRDFTKRYKRTILGFAWSILSPLLLLVVMNFVYTAIFGREEHYSVFLFSGYVQYQYFNTCTKGVMRSIAGNANIISKVNVEKILFVISENVSYLITFLCTLSIYFLFVRLDGIRFTPILLWTIVPICYLVLMTFSVGLIVSVVYVYVRDLKYFYPVLCRIMLYLSAVFYNPSIFPDKLQILFWANPLYLGIYFMRSIVIDGVVPNGSVFLLMFLVLAVLLGGGVLLYQRCKKSMYLYL